VTIELTVDAPSQVHDAHATAAELFEQLVATDLREERLAPRLLAAGDLPEGPGVWRRQLLTARSVEEQELAHLDEQLIVSIAGALQERLSLVFAEIESSFDDIADQEPVL